MPGNGTRQEGGCHMSHRKKKIRLLFLFVFVLAGLFFTYIGIRIHETKISIREAQPPAHSDTPVTTDITEPPRQTTEPPLMDAAGTILKERIHTPAGYERIPCKKDSLTNFLRNYKMKRDGKPVLLYDGTKKSSQNAHAAIFKLPIEREDLQQCADSVMRVYAEYFWHTGKKERIAFHLADGFYAEYRKWREGYRIQISERSSNWVKTASPDDSYEIFQKYMRIIFAYAGTLSMEKEAKKIPLSKINVGDIFIRGGSPGHVVMVVDLCKNTEGKKAFLLAQGYMPAQEFHVLKNPLHETDPWYYVEEITYPFATPEYTFEKGSLRHLTY